MALAQINQITGRGVPVSGDDIDTDRIIPARFMKCVTFDGLGEYAFYDVRFDQDGKSTNHNLDNPKFQGASILVSGKNFGCGSSREHAPQSLWHFGMRAVVANSFAEIFFGNCTTLGIPCVTLDKASLDSLSSALKETPDIQITLDLETKALTFGDSSLKFEIPEAARQALIKGQWDPLGQLLENASEVSELEEKLPY